MCQEPLFEVTEHVRIAHGETVAFHVSGGGLSRAQSGETAQELVEDGRKKGIEVNY